MAYTSYESTKPSFISKDWPVIIMHGLLGSKANWNAMSKMLHSKTNRKVSLYALLSDEASDSVMCFCLCHI
jgi:hypothetical protein